MNAYYTLFGQEVRLELLNVRGYEVALRLLQLKDEHLDAWKFGSAARQMLRRIFVRHDHYSHALRGDVGAIYRDSFYRLLLAVIPQEQRAEALKRLQYSPYRLLIDRYLDGNWRYGHEFEQDAQLPEGTLQALINYLSGKEESLHAADLLNAFAGLDIIAADTARPSKTSSATQEESLRPAEADSPSVREWTLVRLTAAVAKHLAQKGQQPTFDAYWQAIASQLSWLFSIKDYNALADFVGALLEEVHTSPDDSTKPIWYDNLVRHTSTTGIQLAKALEEAWSEARTQAEKLASSPLGHEKKQQSYVALSQQSD